jgi:uncharacterized delta-60 repeat protein
MITNSCPGNFKSYCRSKQSGTTMKKIYFILIAFFNTIICFAQAGTLDSTFSDVGFFRADGKSFSTGTLQADNKFVIAGSGFPFRPGDFVIYRYTSEGLPDGSFGTGGTATATVGGNTGLRCVLIQQDGKILVLGDSRSANTTGNGTIAINVVVRLNANGTIDETFGDHGVVRMYYGNATSVYFGTFSMALQQDGKILVSGPDYIISDSTFSLWRLNINGSIDNSFGTNGRVIKTLTAHAFSTKIVVQPDGKIIYCGETTGYDRFVARFLPSGMPDPDFNGSGIFLHQGQGRFVDAAIQADGKILAAIDLGNSFYLQRINANGTPDNIFGFNGLIETKFNLPVYTGSVDVQENGKILVGGAFAPNPGAFGYGMALARYLPSGILDTIFGSSGMVMKYFGYSTGGVAIGLTKQRVYMIGSGSEQVVNYVNYGVLAAFKVAEAPHPCENDNTPPVVTCTPDIILRSSNSKIYSIPELTAEDHCGVKSINYSIGGATSRSGSGTNAGGTFNIGVSFINWRVTDSSNNVTTCRSTVTIRPPSSAVTVTVPGTANPWLAGMPNGTQSEFGDYAPANSPVLVNLNLTPGSWVQVSNITGTAAHWPPAPTGPEGCLILDPCIFTNISHDIGAEHGKSNLTAPINSLIGVFLDNNIPQNPAPASLDFSTMQSRDYLDLHPQLKQVFFIGDGKTNGGVQQKITVPPGATRLFLGIMDGIEWINNTGAFNVTVNIFNDVIAGNCGSNKVLVCHKGKNLCIASSAVPAHLAHGDQLGSCFGSLPDKTKGKKGDASVLNEQQARRFRISNAPNPFHKNTRLEYEIPGDGHVSIKVYDVLGREMATLVNSGHKVGTYFKDFSANNLSDGTYYYRVTYTTDEHQVLVKTGKMVMVK